ncbi:MAG: VanW family protein [Defluviitaleaceae bacterium]|nr:VanW family protein [Defluviitaleaceae bacterium]
MGFSLRKRKLIILIIITLLLAGFLILWMLGSPPDEADRIYTNVYIHSVAVGGMTGVEAEAALMERFQTGLDARVVRYLIDNAVAHEIAFENFGARFDFSELISDALDYSQMGSLRLRVGRLFGRDLHITDLPIFTFSTEKMEDEMKKLSEKLDVSAQNAAFREENGVIIVTAESAGRGIDIEAAAEATQQILESLENGEVELSVIPISPLFTTKDFNFTTSVLGEFTTPCSGGGNEARRRNIIRAAERVNSSVVFPDETFSAGAIIAAHLPDSGYETAIVLVRGEPAEDIGGGVCQVVTTLYNAVLHAELEIVQRHNHSARVSYVDIGFDATVAGDYYDLKFKNNTQHPLLITARVENESLLIKIHGYETRDVNRKLRFSVREIELLLPEPYREVVDPAIPRGARVVTLESQMGYHVELIKHVYENDIEVEQIKINTSIYKPLQGTIAIGAG